MPIKKKRVRLSVEEKILILNHRKENPLLSKKRIALDFSAKLKKNSWPNMRHQSPSEEIQWGDYPVLHNFSEIIKNDSLDDRKKSSFLFFWNPSRTQVVTFSWGQKGCDYLGMCDYLGCDYLEALQYFFYFQKI